MAPLREFMKNQFDVSLKVWYHVPLESNHESVDNIIPIVESLDPWVLNSVFQSAAATKSAAIALALIWKDGSGLAAPASDKFTLEEAVAIARVDERH